MKATLARLGIIASYSRLRVSDDNPFSEALFRIRKYRPAWPRKGFASKTDAQAWVKAFMAWYNAEHSYSALRFVTEKPSRRSGAPDDGKSCGAVILVPYKDLILRWDQIKRQSFRLRKVCNL